MFILLLNLLPVVSAVVFGWSLLSLMLLYWAENLIVGAINAAKMIAAGVTKGPAATTSLLFYVPFFVVHYGLFCAVHGVLILVLFSGAPEHAVDNPFDIPRVFLEQIHLNAFVAWNLILIATYHLYRFVMDWLWTRQWRNTTPLVQMFMPYGRIIVVHIAVLAGGFAASLIGSPIVAVLLLALLKTALEAGAAKIAVDTEKKSSV